MTVKKGDKLKVEYEGTLEDGTVFDSTQHDGHSHPLEFEVGAGQVIKGFEDAVIGMKESEEKEIKLQPSEAYGDHNPDLIKKLPREQFPQNQNPKAGMVVVLGLPGGKQIRAKITELSEETVSIDLNHPLAGKTLNFKIKIVGISS